jgi:adenosylcobalamin-dependent ribonucleoside-triphosphate reductase
MHSFKLSSLFLDQFIDQQPNWGYGALSYITFKRTYARNIPDEDRTEEFWETCKRVVEGVFNIQKTHCLSNKLYWDNRRAQKSAQIMFQKMWEFKFLPPGRGLWMMGTDMVFHKGSAALNNCGFVSTKEINHGFASPFCWAMDMLMLGVGIGFDTKGAGKFIIKEPKSYEGKYVIPDSREGWIEALDILLSAYEGRNLPEFIFSEIREAGTLINGFGGTASGSGPLKEMLESIRKILDSKISEDITSVDIVDIMNFIGKCVVAGNVRRSAEVALGEFGDESFITCKDFKKYKNELLDRRWASNNSVFAPVGGDYTFTSRLTALNGEPGYAWEENIKAYGRMKDAPDYKDENFAGLNPCMEQVLETYELCCLVETFPANHESAEEYYDTLKYAYMYAKTVTLIPTHDARTNAVMLRNRRIGLSQSGIEQAKARHGIYHYYSNFCDKGYDVVKSWDNVYSGWLCIPTSKRVTSVKPSGTVSILAGATPGVHAAHSKFYYRTIRLAGNSSIVTALFKAGYRIEYGATERDKFASAYAKVTKQSSMSPEADIVFASPIVGKVGKEILDNFAGTVVVYFPIEEKNYNKGKYDITIWEQMENVAKMQHYWADNSVSCTITFKPEEASDIKTVLELYQDRLKVVSFLPLVDHGYAQAPYQTIDETEYIAYSKKLKTVVLNEISEQDKQQDKYCTGEACEIDITEKIKK